MLRRSEKGDGSDGDSGERPPGPVRESQRAQDFEGAEPKLKTLGNMDMQSWGSHARCAWLPRSGDGEGDDSDAGERLPPLLRESQRAEGLLVRP